MPVRPTIIKKDNSNILELPDEVFAKIDPNNNENVDDYNENGGRNNKDVKYGTLKELQTSTVQLVKLTGWLKEPTVYDLKKDLEAARSYRNEQVAKVEHWDSLRDGGRKLRKKRGRSAVRPKLIRRQAEWRYSSLSEPFLSSDKIFQISPRTFEDSDSANQNELLINWQFQTKLNLVELVNEIIRTGVDEGTVILRIGWKREEKEKEVKVPIYNYLQVYEGSEQEQTLQQALELQQTNPRGFLELDPAIQASVTYSQENQVAVWAVQDGEEYVTQNEIIQNHPIIEIVDYRNVYIDPSCKGNVDNAAFIIISFETSKADLIKDGRYQNLDAINWTSSNLLNEFDHGTETPDDFNFEDDLRKRVVAYEYWGMFDINESGIMEPIVATWVNDQMIRLEANPYPDRKAPFEFINYLPKKQSVYGEPDAELIEDNQAIAGAVTRGMIDLLGRSANSQQGIQKGLLDVTNRRRWEAGEDYEYNPTGNPTTGLIQHTYPEIPASALNMLNIQNQEAEGLTGVKAFSGGITGESYGDTTLGVHGVLDAAAKREMNILRRFANGFKAIGQRIMAMNAVFLTEEEVVRVTNQKFVTIKKEDIQGDFDLIVDISTPEIDEKKSQDLAFMLQTLGPTTPLPFTQMILSRIAALKRMPELAHQIENYQPEPDPLEEAAKELEIKKMELEIQKIDSEIKKNLAHADKLESEADATDLETEMMGSGLTHAQNMEKQSEQARGNQDLEITKALVRGKKENESEPNIAAGVGYNTLSKNISNASNRPKSVLPPQPPIQPPENIPDIPPERPTGSLPGLTDGIPNRLAQRLSSDANQQLPEQL